MVRLITLPQRIADVEVGRSAGGRVCARNNDATVNSSVETAHVAPSTLNLHLLHMRVTE